MWRTLTMAKPRTPAQLANDERLRQQAKARREQRENLTTNQPTEDDLPVEPQANPEPVVVPDQNIDDMKRQIAEMQENMDLMRKLLVNQQNAQPNPSLQGATTGVSMNQQGDLIGEWEKYLVDPSNYPDPTPRLKAEPRLRPIAFEFNYEMEYEVGVSSYQTKTGKNIREPKFQITLNRVVLDDQGQPTNKRYIARRMVFHEDPQAALVIARDNGLTVDKSDEKLFLNEMRYLRVRDWLFDIFWPKPVQEKDKIRDEVIGGTVVQVFTKNSVEPGNIPFDQLNSKIRA